MELNTDFSQVLQESKEVIKQCFQEYSLDEVFLSFNGGKDCTVLLDITLATLQETTGSDVSAQLKVLYVRTGEPFEELETFVTQIEDHYRINLIVTQGDLKLSLEDVLNRDKTLRACLMGTRRTDPFSKDLNFMQKTDPGWPQVMRVSPLLNWSYHQIWSYIHNRKVPYCSLYDRGYTSIGSTSNTSPNPALKSIDNAGQVTYSPAWLLNDGSLERAGRGSKQNVTANGHCDIKLENVNA